MIFKPIDIKNSLYLLLAQASAVLVGLFAFTKIGNQLQVQELGRFGFAISSTAFFGILAEFGTRYSAIKEIALDPQRSYQIYKYGARIRWLLSLISLLLLFTVVFISPWRAECNLLLLAGLVAVTQYGSDPATWVFFGKNRIDRGALILVLDRILYLIAIYIASLFKPSAEELVLSVMIANIMRMLISGYWVRKQFNYEYEAKWDPALFRKILTGGTGIGIAIISFIAYSQLTIVLMQSLSAPQELGYYAMGFGIISVLLVIPSSILMALFPVFASKLSEEKLARNKMLETVMRINLIITLPVAAIFFMFPDSILQFWMGVRYAPASLILKILAIGLMFSALNFMYRLFLFASNRYKTETLLNAGAIILTLCLGIPVYKKYGGAGVAVIFVLTEGILITFKIIFTRSWLGDIPFLKLLLPCLISVIVPGIFVWHNPFLIPLAKLLIYASGVLILMFLLKVFPLNFLRKKNSIKTL